MRSAHFTGIFKIYFFSISGYILCCLLTIISNSGWSMFLSICRSSWLSGDTLMFYVLCFALSEQSKEALQLSFQALLQLCYLQLVLLHDLPWARFLTFRTFASLLYRIFLDPLLETLRWYLIYPESWASVFVHGWEENVPNAQHLFCVYDVTGICSVYFKQSIYCLLTYTVSWST